VPWCSSFRSGPSPVLIRLELEAALARGIGQRLDAAVVAIGAAVEHHGLDALFAGALGDELAHRLRGVDVGAGLDALALGLRDRRRVRERRSFGVVDGLRVDVLGRAHPRQPRPSIGRALDGAAYARLPPVGPILETSHGRLPSLLLAFLAEDLLVRILD